MVINAANNLNEVIKSNTSQMKIFTDTIKYVVSNCKNIDKRAIDNTKNTLEYFKTVILKMSDLAHYVVNTFGTINVFSNVNKSFNSIIKLFDVITSLKFQFSKYLKFKFNLWVLTRVFKHIYSALNKINNHISSLTSIKHIFTDAILVVFLSLFEKIKIVAESISLFGLKFLISMRFKLYVLKKFTKRLIKTFIEISEHTRDNLKGILSAAIVTTAIQYILITFERLVMHIKNFLSFKDMLWLWFFGKGKIKRIKKISKYINAVISAINEIRFNVNIGVVKVFANLLKLEIILTMVKRLIFVIRHLKIPLFFKFKAKRVISVINTLNKVIFKLDKLVTIINRVIHKRKIWRANKNIQSIKLLLHNIFVLISSLILLTPIIILFILVSPIILLCFWAFGKIINIIVRIIIKSINLKVIAGLVLLVAVIGIILVIGLMLVVISEIASNIGAIITNTLLLLLGIVIISTIIAGLGFLLGSIMTYILPAIAGLLFIVVIIGIILLIAVMLDSLQKTKIDKMAIKQVVSDIMESLMAIIEAIFNSFSEAGGGKEGEPWYANILNFMGGAAKTLLTSIMSIFPLALSLISIGLIQLLARQLKDIESITLDKVLIKDTVSTVIECAMMVIGGVFQKDDKNRRQPKSFFDKLLRLALPENMLDMMDALSAIGKLTLAWIAVGLVKNIAESLKTILEIELNHNTIQNKTESILTTADSIVNIVFKNADDNIGKKVKTIDKYLGCIDDVIEELIDIADELSEISSLKQESIDNIVLVTNTMISILNDLATKIKAGVWSVDKRTSQMKELYKVIRDFSSLSPSQVKNSEAISKNYIALLDKIGTTDIEKLKTTVNLFEKMSEFSKSINGNFEGLAEALNEKIAPLLEKIQNGMDGLKSSVEQSSADVSSSVYAASQGTLTDEEMKKQVGRENPQASEKDRNDMAMRRMQQQIAKQNSELASNIDELISLFRNGSARVTLN